jgi:hypothetical protein
MTQSLANRGKVARPPLDLIIDRTKSFLSIFFNPDKNNFLSSELLYDLSDMGHKSVVENLKLIVFYEFLIL